MTLRNTCITGLVYFFSLIAINFPCFSAENRPPALNTTVNYVFSWNSIPFGKCKITLHEEAGKYRYTASINLVGVAQMISSHESSTTLDGIGVPSVSSAHIYESNYSTRGKQKHVKLSYSKGGALAKSVVEPPESAGKRPPPDPAQLTSVADPLTYIAELRGALQAAIGKSERSFRLRGFDGRRLFDTTWKIEGEQTLKIGARTIPVYRATASRSAIAGFTIKELNTMKDEPAITVYFSKADLIPVKLTVDMWFGTIEGERQGL